MSLQWSLADPAQNAYERLRAQVLLGEDLEADRMQGFHELGLAGLLLGPSRQTSWLVTVHGAKRPRWTPYEDPREQALVDTFAFVLAAEMDREGWR